jgi:hypothetical protein
MISRRQFFSGAAAVPAMGRFRDALAELLAAEQTIPGAIRWDAWYAPSDVNTDVDKSLGPPEWHSRAPWFARPIASDSIAIDGGQQTTLDAEIRYAVQARLQYWAFVWYGAKSPMQSAWRLYQSSKLRNQVKWCLLLAVSNQGGAKGFKAASPEYIGYLAQPNYQTVLNRRPLLYVLMDSDKSVEAWGGYSGIAASLRDFRHDAQQSGTPDPYVVLLRAPAKSAAGAARACSFDAISTYVPIMKPGYPISWEEQEGSVERVWKDYADTGLPMVLNCVTGWDQRPRLEKAERRPGAHQDLAEPHHNYTIPPTTVQLTAHLQSGVDYVLKHPNSFPSKTILIYSWDECDEGGNAIVPSYTPSGPNTSIVDALRRVAW